jgi:hypothetical protein
MAHRLQTRRRRLPEVMPLVNPGPVCMRYVNDLDLAQGPIDI